MIVKTLTVMWNASKWKVVFIAPLVMLASTLDILMSGSPMALVDWAIIALTVVALSLFWYEFATVYYKLHE